VDTDDDSIAREAKAAATQKGNILPAKKLDEDTCETKQNCICNEEERRTGKKEGGNTGSKGSKAGKEYVGKEVKTGEE
jgi:hypothetical protein